MSKEINNRIIELLHKRLQQGFLTDEETIELKDWVQLSPDNRRLYSEIMNEDSFHAAMEEFQKPDTEASLRKVRQRIFETETVSMPRRATNKIPWRIAAAIIPILLAGGVYFFYPRPNQSVTAEKGSDQTVQTELVPPGGDKARLTLSNGALFVLDNSEIGQLAIKESAITHGEKLLYDIAKAKNTAGEVMFNTLSIPRGLLQTPAGTKREIILPDNSHVWLSAASAIRFPLAFSGNERRVELTGEAYFEISKDATKPFYVDVISEKGVSKEAAVRVLGTHFTVKAYDNDKVITTTLMEGSVEVAYNKKTEKLVPGQQAILAPGKSITIKDNIDIKSWSDRKTGIFAFNNAPVTEIMNQVQRMYDINVLYEGALPGTYTTTLYQSESITELVKALNKTDFDCVLEGQTLTVKAKR